MLVRMSAVLVVAIALVLTSRPTARQHVRADDIPYGVGTWDPDTLGNHRAVVHVAAKADAVRVRVPWRQRDLQPDKKNLIVVDAATGARVTNVVRLDINREYGDLAFEPATAPGDYLVYYLPYVGSVRSNYPRITYSEPEQTADAGWLERTGLSGEPGPPAPQRPLPEAQTIAFQPVDEFSSVYPMEVIATRAETEALLARHPGESYLLFPEDRRYPIRMIDDLPKRWVDQGANRPFRGGAARGEFYAFQIGVFASARAIEDLDVRFTDLRSSDGATVPASRFRCINLGGRDWTGKVFRKVVAIERGKVQPIWCGVEIPTDTRPGPYRATVTVAPRDLRETAFDLLLDVSTDVIEDAGDDEPWRHSRLRWLDSTLALDDEPVAPYTPVRVRESTIDILGRSLTIDTLGLPGTIRSRFAPEMTHLSDTARDVLAGPIALVVEDEQGQVPHWRPGGVRMVKQAAGIAAWESSAAAAPLSLLVHGEMEFDGRVEYTLALRATQDVRLRDIRLEIPYARDVAVLMMGMGLKGGLRPRDFDWSSHASRNQDSAWIGDVNAGLQFSLRDDRYSRPLNTNFYTLKPLVMPASWSNDGRGGCRFRERGGDTFLAACFSGPGTLVAGETQRYDFTLLVTPFHALDTEVSRRRR